MGIYILVASSFVIGIGFTGLVYNYYWKKLEDYYVLDVLMSYNKGFQQGWNVGVIEGRRNEALDRLNNGHNYN